MLKGYSFEDIAQTFWVDCFVKNGGVPSREAQGGFIEITQSSQTMAFMLSLATQIDVPVKGKPSPEFDVNGTKEEREVGVRHASLGQSQNGAIALSPTQRARVGRRSIESHTGGRGRCLHGAALVMSNCDTRTTSHANTQLRRTTSA